MFRRAILFALLFGGISPLLMLMANAFPGLFAGIPVFRVATDPGVLSGNITPIKPTTSSVLKSPLRAGDFGHPVKTLCQSTVCDAQPAKLLDAPDNLVVATNYMSVEQRADVQSFRGALDLTATVQQIVNDNAGRTILLPKGKWNFTSRITIPMGTCVEGQGFGELPIATPNNGTVVIQNYPASTDPYGFYVIGSGSCIRNLEIQQPQPAPSLGWTPNIGPWAIYADANPYADAGGHRLTVDHVMLRNVYDGVQLHNVRGGLLRDIFGQPLHYGLYISGNGDEPHLADIHLGWTYWSGDENVMNWQYTHAVHYLFGRVDNPKGNNLFSFGGNIGYRFFDDTSHKDSNYDGVTSAGEFANVEGDACGATCFAIEDNPEVSFVNFHASPNPLVSTTTCLSTYGVKNPGANFGNLRLTIVSGSCVFSGSSAFSFKFTPEGIPLYPQYIKLIGIRIGAFNLGQMPSTPAIYAAPGVTVYAPDLTVDNVTNPLIKFNGGGVLLPLTTESQHTDNDTSLYDSYTHLSVTVRELGVCSTVGQRKFATDLLGIGYVYGATAIGGGSRRGPVFCDGFAWREG